MAGESLGVVGDGPRSWNSTIIPVRPPLDSRRERGWAGAGGGSRWKPQSRPAGSEGVGVAFRAVRVLKVTSAASV